MAFEKGKSGNPGGRPSAARQELDTLLGRIWTTKKREAALKRLIDLTEHPNPDLAMDAIKLLLAYAYGKPVDRKELSGPDGDALIFKVYERTADFDPDAA